ncbi:hypothetical protein GCM10009836_45760 [Pseudonocardia ailaonensis]|uniref:Uncharacterized protein n=1 Tax=Pseudonocardia ailaonensis TaxID=367279 RepID=A0ABN2NCU8_9PSEU
MLETVTQEHADASARILAEIASGLKVVGPDTVGRGETMVIRFSHFQHDGFLNPLLSSFSSLPLANIDATLPEIPHLRQTTPEKLLELAGGWAALDDVEAIRSRKAATVYDPKRSKEEQPFRIMISANDSVETQIVAALSTVASLLGRQNLIRADQLDVTSLTDETNRLDLTSHRGVKDANRAFGWKFVADQLRQQSIAQGTFLNISYSGPAYSAKEIAERAPLMRYIYNSRPEVRSAVDRVVAAMATNFRVTGSAAVEVMQRASETVERTLIRKYLAHFMRDLFVCGNGILDYGDNPLTDIRLVRPEDLLGLTPEGAPIVIDGDGSKTLPKAMHLSGSDQIGSPLGVSYLEPFLEIVSERSMWIEILLTGRVWAIRNGVPGIPEVRRAIDLYPEIAIERLSHLRGRLVEVLGTVSDTFADPPKDLYFPGQAMMSPAVKRIQLAGDGAR